MKISKYVGIVIFTDLNKYPKALVFQRVLNFTLKDVLFFFQLIKLNRVTMCSVCQLFVILSFSSL